MRNRSANSRQARVRCRGDVCSTQGIPLALFVDGEIYLPVSAGMPGAGSNEQLKPFAEQQV